MEPRERLLAAMDGEEPDHVPCALSFYHLDLRHLPLPRRYRKDQGDIQFIQFPLSPEEKRLRRLAQPYEGDTRLGTSAQATTYARWGYRPASRHPNPLATVRSLEELQAFPFPDLGQPYAPERLTHQVEALHARGLAAGGNLPHLGGELFEAAWRLRGLENFLLDLIERPDWVDFLLDRLADLACRNAEALARAGVDVLALDDDVGMPGTMVFSPTLWRRFFKPRLDRIIRSARAIKPDLRILYHSDGFYEPIVGDLMEIGVQAIHPLQPEYMDAERIRRKFGTRLALWGAVGRQTTFSFGSPEDIRREVKYRLQSLGRAGLILGPAYDVDEPDIPWQNIVAFLEAVREYG